MSKSGHTENIAELTLSLAEDIAEQEIPDGALEALAVRSGLDMSREDLLTALAVYRKRKGLQPDLVNGCFIKWGAETTQAEEKGQPKDGEADQMMALGGPQPAAFHELGARLAAARVNNEALRQSLVPGLTIETLDCIMGEQLPYARMSNLLVGLKEYQQKHENWTEHELAQLIWNVLSEEFRAQRHGRNSSAPQGNQGGGGETNDSGTATGSRDAAGRPPTPWKLFQVRRT